jgi:hypothetical protein
MEAAEAIFPFDTVPICCTRSTFSCGESLRPRVRFGGECEWEEVGEEIEGRKSGKEAKKAFKCWTLLMMRCHLQRRLKRIGICSPLGSYINMFVTYRYILQAD